MQSTILAAFLWACALFTSPAEPLNVPAPQSEGHKGEPRRERVPGGTTNVTHRTAYNVLQMDGWTLHIDAALLAVEQARTEKALELLQQQLEEIVRVVPPEAVSELRKVPLWFSPQYPDAIAKAEYHPGEDWLREHGRNPAMVKGVEFTNVRIFEEEMNRMPNFVLHELAHAYHDRVLTNGFANAEIKAAYERSKGNQKYDRVERWNGNGRTKSFERAYALSSPPEFFAENTEAFFSHNDFFPFTREELKTHDPETFALIQRLWRAP